MTLELDRKQVREAADDTAKLARDERAKEQRLRQAQARGQTTVSDPWLGSTTPIQDEIEAAKERALTLERNADLLTKVADALDQEAAV